MVNKIIILMLFLAMPVAAQSSATNHPDEATNSSPKQLQNQTNRDQITATFQDRERVRAICIEGRRLVCGKILKVLPEGLVVDSGYTNLLRQPLTQSWLIPGTVKASRAKNLIEENKPGANCIGLVFLTHLPKGKKFKPAQYDYVIIEGYPAGQHTYTSVGSIQRTARQFSASLGAAVDWNLETARNKAAP
jgi:hypothetical protein